MLRDVGFLKNCRRFALRNASPSNETACQTEGNRDRWSTRLVTCLVIAVCLALGPVTAALGAIRASERAVLDAIYAQTNGDLWSNNTGWGDAAGTECSWHGVTCNADQTNITGLRLEWNNLSGSLPPISALPALTSFTAYGNSLAGSIPPLAGLTQLINFDVDTNQLTGRIPTLSGLTALKYFRVDSNALTGSIPPLTGLTSLSYFNVSRNHLSGSIPPLSGLTALQTFAASMNALSGAIPPIDDLGALQNLYVYSNRLVGPPPTIPSPSSLWRSGSGLCPNSLTPVANAAWDAATGDTPWYSACQSPVTGLYVALNPARLLETRIGSGFTTADGAAQGTGPIATRAKYTLPVIGRAGIPAGAVAVVLNVTPVDPTIPGYFTLWSGVGAAPNASNLNLNPGYTIPNLVISPVDGNGNVAIFNGSSAAQDVVVDVQGYFPASSAYVPMTPQRYLDTRSGYTTVDGQDQATGPLANDGKLDLAIAGRTSIPATGVDGVIFNLTAVSPTSEGYIAAWPTGGAIPNTSNLNLNIGLTIPNLVVSGLDSGEISFFKGGPPGSEPIDLLVDTQGWFPRNSGYAALTPARLLDTRGGESTVDGQYSGIGAVVSQGTLTLQVAGRGGVPSDIGGAVVLNLTAVQPATAGYVTVWPTDSPRPLASNLNLNPGTTIPNLVIAKVGSDGKVSIFNGSQSPTDILVDVQGWLPVDQ